VKIYTYYYYPQYYSELTVTGPDGDGWWDAHYYLSPELGPFTDGHHELDEPLVVNEDFDELDAWWIKDDLNEGFLHLPDKEGDYFAEWDPDWNFTPFFCCVFCPPFWMCNLSHIYLDDNAAEGSPDTVLHEMGHAVMWNVYDEYWPMSCWDYFISGCPWHTIYEAFGAECAWTEGWANFWAIYVKDDPSLLGYNLEYPTWGTPYYWGDGDEVEGRVAGALWDIHDDYDDGDVYDQYDGGFNGIWDTIYDQTDDTFADFWDAWKAGGHNTGDAFYSLYQNTMCYGPNLKEGSNILCYFGETADFDEALNNIGPNEQDLVEIIWARADWTDGGWWYYNAVQGYAWPSEFTQLETGKAYMINVIDDCAWELPSCADIGSAASSLDLVEGANIIHYSGNTAKLDEGEALTNIGPNGLDVAEIIWAIADWTDGNWWYYNVAQDYSNPAKFTHLQTGRAYNLVVSEDCTWDLP